MRPEQRPEYKASMIQLEADKLDAEHLANRNSWRDRITTIIAGRVLATDRDIYPEDGNEQYG